MSPFKRCVQSAQHFAAENDIPMKIACALGEYIDDNRHGLGFESPEELRRRVEAFIVADMPRRLDCTLYVTHASIAELMCPGETFTYGDVRYVPVPIPTFWSSDISGDSGDASDTSPPFGTSVDPLESSGDNVYNLARPLAVESMHVAFVVIGYASMFLTCVSYVPIIVSMIANRSGTNVSVPFLAVLAVDLALYATYGVGMWLETRWDALPMLVGCAVQMVLVAALAVLKSVFWIRGTRPLSKGSTEVPKGCFSRPSGNSECAPKPDTISNVG